MAVVAVQKQKNRSKITRNRLPAITPIKQPLHPEIFYTMRELSDRQSPHCVASAATIYRAIDKKLLTPNYVGRAVLIKGESVLKWIGLNAPLESKKAADLEPEGGAKNESL